MKLHEANHVESVPRSIPVTNACVAAACAAVTGEPAETWVSRFRNHHPKACSARRGTSRLEYVPALEAAGYEALRTHPGKANPWDDDVPMHVALAWLNRSFPNATYLIVVREKRKQSHMVAAQGFMVCDNTVPKPRWWADWVDVWQSSRSYYRRTWTAFIKSKPRPTKVVEAYVVRKKVLKVH